MRIGFGYDVHKLVPDRKLVLGGVEINWELGLLGHSDADVLIHAIMDALLGAAGLGDIGSHFPDTDPQFAGISSMNLLKRVFHLLEQAHYSIINIDATIMAQKPKLSSYIMAMRENISACLGMTADRVNVKATTEEGLGFTGRMEGIAASAVCLIEKKE